MKVVHEWLKEYVGPSLPDAAATADLLMFHAFEIEGVEKVREHDVLDVKILPDRASYCLSHRGIAREIASILGTELTHDPLQTSERLPAFDAIKVDIEDAHACSRFAAALVEGIEVTESPAWLKDRLIAIGQRPINNIVDATNYVMYALGEPLHAYDADKFPQVDGAWQFHVRFARPQEEISLIAESGKEGDRVVTLEGAELLIVDKSSDRPIGLAGIKGGAFAGVDRTTNRIIIEAAHFDPIITRKTSRRLGIVIDGSKRFENNPSQDLVPHALREVVSLIKEIAGGTCAGSIDVCTKPSEIVSVTVDPARVNALLGLSLSAAEIKTYIERIGATVEEIDGIFTVTPPWERNDLNIEEDFTEEVGRLYGYHHIVSAVPEPVPLAEINARHYYSEAVREALIKLGFSEVITSSFTKQDDVQLQNALASDKSYMRSTLVDNIAGVLQKNSAFTDLLGARDTRVFEIGTVFTKPKGVITEHVSLCIGVRTKASGFVPADQTLLLTVIEELKEIVGESLECTIKEGVAECNFTDLLAKLSVPVAYAPVAVAQEITYRPFSTYPAVSRDIALWVTAETVPDTVADTLNESAGELRIRTTLVDVFSKEGRTSYAFRLVFQSDDRTLTDDEVNTTMEVVYSAVQEKGWEVR